jgi:hypothetical protein
MYWVTAAKLKVKRQDIRRAVLVVHHRLAAATDRLQQALGAYLFPMVESSNAQGTGLTKKEMAKQGDQYRVDDAILGGFEVDVTDPAFAR